METFFDKDPRDRDPYPEKRKGCARWLGWALIASAAAAGAIAIFLAATDARAHDALPTAAKPNGWSYPFSCCSGYDCREVGDIHTPNATIRIFERPEGYVISSTGEVLSYTDQRLKDSPDGQFHWCSVAGANNSRTICLFRPPRGY